MNPPTAPVSVAWRRLRAHAEAEGWLGASTHAADAWMAAAPDLPVAALGVEVRLDEDPRVDVGLQLWRDPSCRARLARWAGPVAGLVHRWLDSDCPYLWVEADQEGAGLLPFALVTVADLGAHGEPRTSEARWRSRVDCLFPGALTAGTLAWMRARPHGLEPMHVAALPEHRGGGLRIHLNGPGEAARRWLAPQLPAAAASHLEAAVRTLGHGGSVLGVQVTVHDGEVAPEVGFELYRSVPPSYTDNWQRVLDPLVGAGAASADRAAALTRWWGPEPEGGQRRFYLKLTATARGLLAKGYLMVLLPQTQEDRSPA